MSTAMTHDLPGPGTPLGPCMHSVSFDQCFGWLHHAPEGRSGSIAVLLCPGLNSDESTGHRSFRLLGDALAVSGYPTLRFAYPGTGDSCEHDAGEPWATWQGSIHVAADWLRLHTGADRIVLCGLRLGASLAAVVAEARDDVAGLILFAPVPRGRSYIRQLEIEARVRQGAPPAGGPMLYDVELPAETIRLISQLDLRTVTPPVSCRVVVYVQARSAVMTECAEAWKRRGASVSWEDFGGLEAMLRPIYMSHETPAQVSRVVAWLHASHSAGPAKFAGAPLPDRVSMHPAGCIETPLQFGAHRQLFGMLCRPSTTGESDWAVVIGNSGGDPHYGFNRSTVDLARRMAAAGITSLRIDFDGLGDSGAPGGACTHVFETDRSPDIAAAIDALSGLGYRRFAAQGLCSGAYHALYAGLADPRISALILLNLPLFRWRDGDPIELVDFSVPARSDIMRKLVRKDAWSRLLQGRLDLANRSASQGIWFARKAKAFGARLVGFPIRRAPTNFARESMNRLSPRARILFVFGEGEPGFAELVQAFGSNPAPPGATVRVIPGIDHPLSASYMRRLVAEQILSFLAGNEDVRFPSSLQQTPRASVGSAA